MATMNVLTTGIMMALIMIGRGGSVIGLGFSTINIMLCLCVHGQLGAINCRKNGDNVNPLN